MWTKILAANGGPTIWGGLPRRLSTIVFLMLALLVGACTPSSAQGAIHDDTFSVGSSPKLLVESDGGRVDVRAGPPGVIVVQSSIQNPEKLEYEVRREGDTIIIAAKQHPGLRNLAKLNIPSADIIITAPSTTFIDLITNDGDVEISGMQASGNLVTSNGGITLEDVSGNFNGGTTNGGISIDSMIGNASLETTNGTVRVERGKGAFELATRSGTIYFQGELTPGGKNGFLTSNGNVVVKLDGDPSLRVLASATNGSAVSSLALAAGTADDKNFSGIIGLGEAELVINAANGTVTLE
ncbi:MAG: DUF4097 family beta strand repeat-containing protein [Chloroflexi bacterium]|nr:DUF4097 family beta strand repeat-containing protein [Chloroflexota bacterium]MDA1227589.1 DUF4097 family beta strand repeat-containing protein [Chloroflexota bacterium]